MDRLVDEAEGLVDGSASVCSSGSGGMEPTAEQQLSLLNSITASDLSGESLEGLQVCRGPKMRLTLCPDWLRRGRASATKSVRLPCVLRECPNWTQAMRLWASLGCWMPCFDVFLVALLKAL